MMRTESEHGAQAGAFTRACSLLETALRGSLRREIVASAAASGTLGTALERLRQGLRTHVLKAQGREVALDRFVADYDRRTRAEGFHALHDWDGKADTSNRESIPVDVLNFMIDRRGDEPADPIVLALILDYYFLYILGLLSLRIWDDPDVDANLGRVDALIELLQGPDGSGHQFADDAETLILIATSHYEPNEHGYTMLLDRARRLSEPRQLKLALAHAMSMGCHLRFGFEATYGRDTVVMRDDNVADYPWVCYAIAVLMREYARMHDAGVRGPERDSVVEGLLSGLSFDARAFIGAAPASLGAYEVERSEFGAGFHRLKDDLFQEFEALRPAEASYSPLSLFFNFSHNVVKGTIVDALVRSEPCDVRLNDLFTSFPRRGVDSSRKMKLSQTLMAYARRNPDTIRGRLMPVIVYDPRAGRQAFTVTMRKLRE
jgi:hypothetical protein